MAMQLGHALSGSGLAQGSYPIQDAHSGLPLLKAEGRSRRDGASLVLETRYLQLAAAGSALAGAETLRYQAESLLTEWYLFEDLAAGELAEVKVNEGRATASYRASATSEVKTKELAWSDRTYAGSALPLVILQQWEQLSRGDSFDFDLYVPFRLETVGFRFASSADAEPGEITIVASARNWLIRQFAPSITFVFKAGEVPSLVRYLGPAPVALNGQKHKAVLIDFSKGTVAPAG